MVITSSNVSMSSSRAYSKRAQNSHLAFEWPARSSRNYAVNRSSSYSERSNYGQNGYNDFAMLSYNRKQAGYLNTSTLTNSLAIGSNERDNPLADLETLRATYLEILDMMREANFKRLFSGSRSFAQFGVSTADSSVLSLTSSSSPMIWARVNQNSYFMDEKETTAFESKGSVVTADGRTIDFNVSFEMSREFSESYASGGLSQYERILTDPLIINLDSRPTSVTDKKFFFDLDCDGKEEEISQLASGNGYLALDLNKDGIINDGSELFGTKSGNGFKDLSKYDSDGNGWIDENDEIFSKLRVWTKDEHGKDVLLSLAQADVGAICLKNSSTQFSLKDADGNLNGMVRSSGIYLTESGKVKTLQQVDF